jgi:hypothetical protein|nr:MAG TPA: hypothetical protein [Caudoviricetes sp.]
MEEEIKKVNRLLQLRLRRIELILFFIAVFVYYYIGSLIDATFVNVTLVVICVIWYGITVLQYHNE